MIDTATNTAAATIAVGKHSLRRRRFPDGSTALVSQFSEGSIAEIDTATNTVSGTIKVGNGSWNLAWARWDSGLGVRLPERLSQRHRHRNRNGYAHDPGRQRADLHVRERTERLRFAEAAQLVSGAGRPNSARITWTGRSTWAFAAVSRVL